MKIRSRLLQPTQVSIADETPEKELVEEMAALKAKLKVSSKKLRRQRDEMQDQGRPKPSFG